ncbi:MAG: hypothetical protein IKW76_03040 [Clostridia bacterium]|nr:hypothetical protein [Clostridia bacterium]
MKQTLKKLAERISAFLDRMGEDFDMLLVDDSMSFYADMTGFELFEEELFA